MDVAGRNAAIGVEKGDFATLPTAYLGQVATRCSLNGSRTTASKQGMSRSAHYARDNIKSIRVGWLNIFGTGATAEAAGGSDATITASVEYPAGTYTQLQFSGSVSGVNTAGGLLVSDPAAVNIPWGARFWVRCFRISTTEILFAANAPDPTYDFFEFAASGLTDKTMSGTVGNTGVAGTSGYYPSLIVGMTRRPSIFLAGDSRQAGAYDQSVDGSGDYGDAARALGPFFATLNGGVSSETQAQANSNYTKRLLLAQYCSHVVNGYGINDVIGSASAATLAGRRTTFAALFGTKPVFGTTLTPNTTSTDAFATTANQTAAATESVRLAFNNLVRAGISGEIGYIDIADAIDATRAGVWPANGAANFYTQEGLHGKGPAGALIARSSLVMPLRFQR